MSKVEIRSNGSFSADKIQVVFETGVKWDFDWHQVDPRCLRGILKELGHEVTHDNDFAFDHDKEDPIYA